MISLDWRDNPDISGRVMVWVQSAPSDEWGERWLVAAQAMPRFDRGRSAVNTFLTRCWRYREIDAHRKAVRRPRLVFTEHVDRLCPEPITARRMPDAADLPEIIVLAARGVPLPQIARMIGVPLGTVKSRLHRMRTELAFALS